MVTEQFSYSTAKSPLMLELTGRVRKNELAIRKTLDNLAKYFADKK